MLFPFRERYLFLPLLERKEFFQLHAFLSFKHPDRNNFPNLIVKSDKTKCIIITKKFDGSCSCFSRKNDF